MVKCARHSEKRACDEVFCRQKEELPALSPIVRFPVCHGPQLPAPLETNKPHRSRRTYLTLRALTPFTKQERKSNSSVQARTSFPGSIVRVSFGTQQHVASDMTTGTGDRYRLLVRDKCPLPPLSSSQFHCAFFAPLPPSSSLARQSHLRHDRQRDARRLGVQTGPVKRAPFHQPLVPTSASREPDATTSCLFIRQRSTRLGPSIHL